MGHTAVVGYEVQGPTGEHAAKSVAQQTVFIHCACEGPEYYGIHRGGLGMGVGVCV